MQNLCIFVQNVHHFKMHPFNSGEGAATYPPLPFESATDNSFCMTETQAGSSELDESTSLSGTQREKTTSDHQQRDSNTLDRGRLASPIPVRLFVSISLLLF